MKHVYSYSFISEAGKFGGELSLAELSMRYEADIHQQKEKQKKLGLNIKFF